MLFMDGIAGLDLTDPCSLMSCGANADCNFDNQTLRQVSTCQCKPGYKNVTDIDEAQKAEGCSPNCGITESDSCPICNQDEACLQPSDCLDVLKVWRASYNGVIGIQIVSYLS